MKKIIYLLLTACDFDGMRIKYTYRTQTAEPGAGI